MLAHIKILKENRRQNVESRIKAVDKEEKRVKQVTKANKNNMNLRELQNSQLHLEHIHGFSFHSG